MRPLRSLVAAALAAGPAAAGDNELTPREKAAGRVLLSDGKTLGGWATRAGQPGKTPVEDGCTDPHRCGHDMTAHKDPWENFVLALDFKISPKCNSGVFIRPASLAPRPGKDVGFNGIEVALDDTPGAGTGSRWRSTAGR